MDGEVNRMPMTSVNVDADLLAAAKRALGVTTNREAINLALHDAAWTERVVDAIESLAGIDLEPEAEQVAAGDA